MKTSRIQIIMCCLLEAELLIGDPANRPHGSVPDGQVVDRAPAILHDPVRAPAILRPVAPPDLPLDPAFNDVAAISSEELGRFPGAITIDPVVSLRHNEAVIDPSKLPTVPASLVVIRNDCPDHTVCAKVNKTVQLLVEKGQPQSKIRVLNK